MSIDIQQKVVTESDSVTFLSQNQRKLGQSVATDRVCALLLRRAFALRLGDGRDRGLPTGTEQTQAQRRNVEWDVAIHGGARVSRGPVETVDRG